MKKFIKFFLLSILAFVFLGCPNPIEPKDPVTYTVTYSTEHGTKPEPITVEEETVLSAEQLKTLTAEGFTFKGWFDGETQAIAGKYKVTKDVTLTAKWEVVPPPAPKEFTVTFKTEHGIAPEALTVEKDTILTAEQLKALTFDGFIFKGWFDGETEAKAGEYKVTKDVTLTAKWEKKNTPANYDFKPAPQSPTLPECRSPTNFPFTYGQSYTSGKNNTYEFIFNQDGTAKYEVTEDNEIEEGFEYKYVVDTDNKAIYCYVEKFYFKGLMGSFSGYMTYDELVQNFKKILDEDYFRETILENPVIKYMILMEMAENELGEDYEQEEFEEFVKGVTEDDMWETFQILMTEDYPEDISFFEMMAATAPQSEKQYQDIFSTIQKYEYEVDTSTNEPKSIKRVIYEEATLKDMISYTSTGVLKSKGVRENIKRVELNETLCYFLQESFIIPIYHISELKDGKIYIDNTFGVSEECKKEGYPDSLDPIPYTESGKGENLVVNITFQGNEFELKYYEKTTVIEFN